MLSVCLYPWQTLLVKSDTNPIPSRHCTASEPFSPQVMESPGLAYVIFSQVASLFPGSSFWAIMFFMVLVITGLGTMIMLLEGIVPPLQNNIPTFTKYPKLVPGTKPFPATCPIPTSPQAPRVHMDPNSQTPM